MTTIRLPGWAEDVLRRHGPQPAYGAAEPDPDALARYRVVTARFRRRWRELAVDVWPLFGVGDTPTNARQAEHLLALMIDLARAGSPADLGAKRQALEDLGRVEDELRHLAEQVSRKVSMRATLMHDHLVEGGLEDHLVDAFAHAATDVAMQSWSEPRLHNVDMSDAINSRKTAADALKLLLHSLDRAQEQQQLVELTDKARATIYNVVHDARGAGTYGAENIKVARARLRASR